MTIDKDAMAALVTVGYKWKEFMEGRATSIIRVQSAIPQEIVPAESERFGVVCCETLWDLRHELACPDCGRPFVDPPEEEVVTEEQTKQEDIRRMITAVAIAQDKSEEEVWFAIRSVVESDMVSSEGRLLEILKERDKENGSLKKKITRLQQENRDLSRTITNYKKNQNRSRYRDRNHQGGRGR